MSEETLVVLVTAPTIEEAAQIGCALVEERLAASANLVPGMRSIYRWQEAIHDHAEVLLIIKTTAAALDRLTQRVVELHSYQTPAVVALPIVGGSTAYLHWLAMQVGSEEKL